MPKNIRVLFEMLVSAAQCGNYMEVSKTMKKIADYSEALQGGQPHEVAKKSKEYIKNMRECAKNVVTKQEWAVYQFKDICANYVNEVLIPWLNENSEGLHYGSNARIRDYSS